MINNWYTSKEIKKILGITPQHLYALKKAKKVNFKKVTDKKYIYQLPVTFEKENQENIAIYARVSTPKQKKDLENQINLLKQYCVSNGNIVRDEFVFKDIASGMNENRNGLNALFDQILAKNIATVVISSKDRLTRFGFGYLETLAKRFGTKIIVVNAPESQSFQEELANDLISVIHEFANDFHGSKKNILILAEKALKQTP